MADDWSREEAGRRFPIEVVEYDPRWPELYEEEARLLKKQFGDLIVRIEHIGSTEMTTSSAVSFRTFAPSRFRDSFRQIAKPRKGENAKDNEVTVTFAQPSRFSGFSPLAAFRPKIALAARPASGYPSAALHWIFPGLTGHRLKFEPTLPCRHTPCEVVRWIVPQFDTHWPLCWR